MILLGPILLALLCGLTVALGNIMREQRDFTDEVPTVRMAAGELERCRATCRIMKPL